MARYRIKSLNYITSGNGKTLVNMDIQRPYVIVDPLHFISVDAESDGGTVPKSITTDQGNGYFKQTEYIRKDPGSLCVALAQEGRNDDIVLNEQQKYFFETDRHINRINLMLSCCTSELDSDSKGFNDRQTQLNVTYNLDKANADPLNAIGDMFPMYDMKDVCVRETHEITNLRTRTYRENVYLPDMTQDPIGFCQTSFSKDTYMLTETTRYRPSYLYSNVSDSSDMLYDRYTVGLRTDDDSSTYLYDAETISSMTMKDMDDLSAFTPKVNIKNIRYNHVSQIPTSFTSDPDSGDVLAQAIYPCKNAYDSQYSMNMPSQDSLVKCREYCGIDCDSDIVYLKYYDNVDYHGDIVGKTGDVEMDISAHNGNPDKYPYQKVECINTFSSSSGQEHKSNIFSVRLKNSAITDTDNPQVAGMQKEIRNAIREIVKNVCPVNVQLFDVMFTEV